MLGMGLGVAYRNGVLKPGAAGTSRRKPMRKALARRPAKAIAGCVACERRGYAPQ